MPISKDTVILEELSEVKKTGSIFHHCPRCLDCYYVSYTYDGDLLLDKECFHCEITCPTCRDCHIVTINKEWNEIIGWNPPVPVLPPTPLCDSDRRILIMTSFIFVIAVVALVFSALFLSETPTVQSKPVEYQVMKVQAKAKPEVFIFESWNYSDEDEDNNFVYTGSGSPAWIKARQGDSPEAVELRRLDVVRRKACRRAWVNGGGGEVIKTRYDRVSEGMSISQVERALGKGGQEWKSERSNRTMSSYRWDSKGITLNVTFVNGKVWSKSQY